MDDHAIIMPPRIYGSPYPDLQLKDIDLTSFVLSNPLNVPLDKPIYIDAVSGESRTFGDILHRTRALAQGLREQLGVKPNDVVALFSHNTIDYAIICHAVIGCGATVSPNSAALTAMELRANLETCDAKCLIVHSSLMGIAQKAIQGTSVRNIIQADGRYAADGTPTAQTLATTCSPSDLITVLPSEVDNRIAFICFSSGTSGRAKGVMTSHKNMTASVQQWQKHVFDEVVKSGQSLIAFLPFSHIYGLNLYICSALFQGMTVVVMPRFDLDVYLGCVQKYRPEDLALVPPVALLLVKDPRVDRYDLRSVKRIMSAAAPLSVELARSVEAKFKQAYGTTVYCYQAWGLTETSPLATAVPISRMDKRDGVGCITPNMEFRFVDPDTMLDAEVDDNGTTKPAEIWCRGPNVTSGYFKNEDATQHAFFVDREGRRWFRTGDIGTIDKEGFVRICDRTKEMIKYKGMQVIPSELEGKLLDHPDVQDAGVIGVWVEEQATELPLAFIVIRPEARRKGKQIVVRDIHEWLNKRVASHKRLRGGIKLVDSIPKNPSGKILRRKLRDLLKNRGAAKL